MQNQHKNKRISPKLTWAIILFFLPLLIIFIAYFYVKSWIIGLDISQLEDPLPEPTFVYDREGQVVSQLSSARFTPVPIEEIPHELIQAIVAVEDQRFFEHKGVDFMAITRSLFRNLKAGEIVQGGSTITQQLAKNLFLSSEQTWSRKLKEAGIAIKIDVTYEKEEILELYLNQIYFGEGTWGVEEASQTYFGKSVRDLNLVESALIAALPKAPTHYSPIKNKEKALERRNLVLALMKDQQYITEKEYQRAIAEPITIAERKGNELKGRYASYVDYVIEEAVTKYGFTEEQILTGGMQIHTHLDTRIQETIQDIYHNDQFFPLHELNSNQQESEQDQNKKDQNEQILQSGTVVLDPYTGGIRGLMGHRGDHVFRGLNRATQLKRQPGSTFKPLAVYAPALAEGYTPFSMLYDGPLNINGYQPKDWDNQTRGQVTLYEAVIKSWNIPAVWLLNEIGIAKSIQFLEKLGITLPQEDRNLSLALGGLTEGVSPLQMAQAFSVFPNLGVVNEAHVITKITTKDGYVLIEAKPKQEEVMSSSNAYIMTLLLQDVIQAGTGKNALLDRPAAGKTGTTQLPATKEFTGIKGAKDAWFVGYTPELVAAVWLGYDQTDSKHYLTTSGGKHPAQIFQEIMSRTLQDTPVTAFKRPENFVLPVAPQKEPPVLQKKGNEIKKRIEERGKNKKRGPKKRKKRD